MDDPDADNDTVRVGTIAQSMEATQPPEVAQVTEAGDYEVRSQALRIDPHNAWHTVTQVITDAIHDIQMVFRDAHAKLVAAAHSLNLLQATYNLIANALDALGKELDRTFVRELGMEPRHYQWLRNILLAPASRPRPQVPLPEVELVARPEVAPDLAMKDDGAADRQSRISSLTPLSSRAGSPMTDNSNHTRPPATPQQLHRDKGKGKRRAGREPTPTPPSSPPSAHQPARKWQRAHSITSDGAPGEPHMPNLPNPRTVELLMRRYPNPMLEQLLNISDAFTGLSTMSYAAAASRATMPTTSDGSRGPSPAPARVAPRANSRLNAEIACKQSKRKRVHGPPGAARRLYVQFTNPPPAEAQASPLTIVGAVNTALANHGDPRMRLRASAAYWTRNGMLYIQFLDIPPEGAEAAIRTVAQANGWGGTGSTPEDVTVEHYVRTSQICFRVVACVDDNGRPLEAQQVAAAAFANSPHMQEVMPVRRISFMPPHDGATTTTLVVEIADTSTLARQRTLIGTHVAFSNGVHYLLNVYNDERSTALTWLDEHQARLPPLDLVVGDFNLHSMAWEPDALHESPRAVDLVNFMAGIGMNLVNNGGQPTHRPHNERLRCTVPDLIWAPCDKVTASEVAASIDLEGQGLSDHTKLSTSIPVGWWELWLPPTIQQRSEGKKAFIKDLTEGVSKIQVETDSIVGVQHTCDAVMAAGSGKGDLAWGGGLEVSARRT
ncbi:hypothetical protein C8Q77DRAFT_1157648 [Trametes polyzona]|nr:hypothetical protein C8Q77DRAFT_1157648 [Trametes polyzona]